MDGRASARAREPSTVRKFPDELARSIGSIAGWRQGHIIRTSSPELRAMLVQAAHTARSKAIHWICRGAMGIAGACGA
jgi:hypothetical protein